MGFVYGYAEQTFPCSERFGPFSIGTAKELEHVTEARVGKRCPFGILAYKVSCGFYQIKWDWRINSFVRAASNISVVTIEAHKEFWQKCGKQFLWVSFSRNSLVHVLAGTMDGFDAEFCSPTTIYRSKPNSQCSCRKALVWGVSVTDSNQLGLIMTPSPALWMFRI